MKKMSQLKKNLNIFQSRILNVYKIYLFIQSNMLFNRFPYGFGLKYHLYCFLVRFTDHLCLDFLNKVCKPN